MPAVHATKMPDGTLEASRVRAINSEAYDFKKKQDSVPEGEAGCTFDQTVILFQSAAHAVAAAIVDDAQGSQASEWVAFLSYRIRDLAQNSAKLSNILSEFGWTGTDFQAPPNLTQLLSKLEAHSAEQARPQTKLQKVLDGIRAGVRIVSMQESTVQHWQETVLLEKLKQKLKQSLDDLEKEDRIIGEGAATTWAKGIEACSSFVGTMFDLQSKEAGSTVTTDHRDKFQAALMKLVSQVRLVEHHIMSIYRSPVYKYKEMVTKAESLLSVLQGDIKVLQEHLSPLQLAVKGDTDNTRFSNLALGQSPAVSQNKDLTQNLEELFCVVPKVHLFQAFENLNDTKKDDIAKAAKLGDRIVQIFKAADSSGDGKVSQDELMRMFTIMNPSWTNDEFEDLFRQADVDGDGHLKFAEFVHWIWPQDEQLVAAVEHYEMAKTVFHKYDKDCNGFINAKELQAYFQEHEGKQIKLEKVKKLMADMDSDSDSKIDCIEFIQYLNWKQFDDQMT